MKNVSTLLFLINVIETDLKNLQVIGSLSEKKEPSFQKIAEEKAPPDGLINALLCYARAMEVADTGLIGRTEWNLN